jgi:DNA-binding CsgD family transcriptional regulator/tetratricopeptide (TPR) repeat protein
VPARQQTLRSTIAWSYHLLPPQEQQLFRSLSVFAGGCTLEAVTAIAQAAGLAANTILDGVSTLLENNLVRQVEQPDGEPRLLLLETIREYGLECLADTGGLEAARAAHAVYYLALAEEAEPHLRGPQQGRWVTHLECDQENLRAALRFLLEQAHSQASTQEGERPTEYALRLCVALSTFWYDRGYGREGLSFLMQALAERAGEGTALRARALDAAASLAFGYALNIPLEQLAEESLALYQELGDAIGIARSLHRLGIIARLRSQFVLAHARLEEAAARFQELGDRWRQGQCSTERARIAMEQGQFEQAHALLEQSLLLYQELGDQQRLGWVRFLLAYLLFVSQQDQPLAQQLAEQSLAHFREQDNMLYSAAPLSLLGLIHMERGELEAARALLENSLAIDKQFGTEAEEIHMALGRLLTLQGDVAAARHHYQESLTLLFEQNVCKENIAASLEGLAALETGQGAPRHAARLWGAAEALRDAIGAPIYPVYRAYLEQAIARARATLGEQAFRTAWAEGRSLTPQQALAAQEPEMIPAGGPSVPQPPPATTQTPAYPDGLTAREVEVLRLLAQGWTDAQIAGHLVISPRTVNRHTISLYSKLNVSSRAAATRYAIEHDLL